MNVFINAISISEGGGLVVLTHLLQAMHNTAPEITWYVAAEGHVLSKLPKSEKIIGLPYSWPKKSPLHHLYWYEVMLPRLVRRTKADVCFSKTNFLPRRKLSCPTLLLIQHAGYFSDKFKQLYLQWYKKIITRVIWGQKNRWLYQSIKRATMITVQTEALTECITNKIDIAKEKIIAIPHGPGLLNFLEQKARNSPLDGVWRVGYITKFGVQKDFDTALKAISLLNAAGVSVKLILTLNTNNLEFNPISNNIKKYNIESMIENHGEMSDPDKLKTLYESLHIFIFPSLCESFGFTLVEAMASGLPVIVADTDTNREVAGLAGIIFPAEDEKHLAEKINYLITHQDSYVLACKNSMERSRYFCWNKTAKNILQTIHRLVDSR